MHALNRLVKEIWLNYTCLSQYKPSKRWVNLTLHLGLQPPN